MSHSTNNANFSVYFLPAAFATLNLVACLCALLAASFTQSRYHNSWNILYNFSQDYKKQFIYIIRLVYFYRKSTVDFKKTSYILQLFQANGTEVTLRIPPKFFDKNQHNTFTSETGIVKFLLIRDTELHLITSISITHDHQGGELNFSIVDLQDSTKTEGYLACFEQNIKAISLDEAKKKQSRKATAQPNMELKGDFAVTQGISAAEFIGPLYMYISIIAFSCTTCLIAYFQNFGQKPSYAVFHSYHEAVSIGVGNFFFLFGLTSFIFVVTKHVMEGKHQKYNLILHLYTAVCVSVGIGFGLRNVSKLDPDLIQFVLKDANFLPHFISLWIKCTILDIGIAVFYGIPFTLIYFFLINQLFKGYEC